MKTKWYRSHFKDSETDQIVDRFKWEVLLESTDKFGKVLEREVYSFTVPTALIFNTLPNKGSGYYTYHRDEKAEKRYLGWDSEKEATKNLQLQSNLKDLEQSSV